MLFIIHTYRQLYSKTWLTSRSLALLEKPPVTQLLKNFPPFYKTRRFITVFTRALHWSLSWTRSIQSIPHHPIYLRTILYQIPCTFCLAYVVYPRNPSQVQDPLWHFITTLFLRWGVVSPTPNPEATLHTGGCVPQRATWVRFMPWWQGTQLTWTVKPDKN
jgi:hypothetical protein